MLSLSTSPAYSIILFQTVLRKIIFLFEAKFPGPFCPIIELMSACIILFFRTFPFSLRGHGGGHFHFKFLAYSIHDWTLSANQNTDSVQSWIDNLRLLKRKVKRWYITAKKTSKSNHWTKYKNLQAEYKKALEQAELAFKTDLSERLCETRNTKVWWGIVKNIKIFATKMKFSDFFLILGTLSHNCNFLDKQLAFMTLFTRNSGKHFQIKRTSTMEHLTQNSS